LSHRVQESFRKIITVGTSLVYRGVHSLPNVAQHQHYLAHEGGNGQFAITPNGNTVRTASNSIGATATVRKRDYSTAAVTMPSADIDAASAAMASDASVPLPVPEELKSNPLFTWFATSERPLFPPYEAIKAEHVEPAM